MQLQDVTRISLHMSSLTAFKCWQVDVSSSPQSLRQWYVVTAGSRWEL